MPLNYKKLRTVYGPTENELKKRNNIKTTSAKRTRTNR